MCLLSFCCHTCGNKKFIFTTYDRLKGTKHGAACAKCGESVKTDAFLLSAARHEILHDGIFSLARQEG